MCKKQTELLERLPLALSETQFPKAEFTGFSNGEDFNL